MLKLVVAGAALPAFCITCVMYGLRKISIGILPNSYSEHTIYMYQFRLIATVVDFIDPIVTVMRSPLILSDPSYQL